MILKPTLVDENNEPIKFPKLRKFYRKPECPEHGKLYVHKSLRDKIFRCTYCGKKLCTNNPQKGLIDKEKNDIFKVSGKPD